MDEENRRPTWLEGEEDRPDRSEKPDRAGGEPPDPSDRPAPTGEPPHLERGSPRPTRVRPEDPDPSDEE